MSAKYNPLVGGPGTGPFTYFQEDAVKRLQELFDKRTGWYEITPEDAAFIVAAQGKNRPLVESRANKIASAILNGKWCPNGQSLILSHDGELCDGQHRLRGCIIANKPITTFVVYLHENADTSFFDTIDQGKPRTAGDRLALEGVRWHNLAASIVRQTLLWERYGVIDTGHGSGNRSKGSGARDTIKVSVGDIHEYHKKHRKRFEEATAAVSLYINLLRGWAPASLVGFVYCQAALRNQKKADEFLHGLATGENLTSDSPVLKLRKRLQQEALQKVTLPNRHILALTIKAWNDFAENRHGRLLSWHEEKEGFPAFATGALS